MISNKKYKTILTFLIVFITLASILLFKSYSDINEQYRLSHNNTVQHQNKSIMLFGMYRAARERLLILYQMSLEIDPFILDELNISLSEQASIFINHRLEYQKLPLIAEEVDLLNQQIKATKIGAQYINNVSSLLINNQHIIARELLTTKAESAQKVVLEIINQQVKIHKEQLLFRMKKSANIL